ncbi:MULTISPECIES: fimbrial protein [unclassified Pseudomonas]|jgi:major type 1 subunit fimbrin (pilin)|uniref:fimbrial protein n=1 Tax=unclassified Pseudomonas TaxID=196821 RepID=UPI0008B33501|nr:MULTISPECIES: fimbrial protein [unclassified Pseudomonas]PMV27388.1 type 1 fimbrial protein [Pseudomonas sp. FW305-3-2-15-C-TSA2]PMV32643.1 type 1 fimbrial protein [Pseudomonas sp. DP16D-L5]PMV42357.1 type 1 fimbrial protein [Pseudomonas sp. FW305-3-2-15-A-LB2]PMV49605.1 type 1 fimbrial protein [Pseudomonas sp. FW305-3-2-15-C-R2A1]PMV55281.1 type 1 fimbrial protein [Pseudomonas sp. FW305-3-2-15-C-LB1]
MKVHVFSTLAVVLALAAAVSQPAQAANDGTINFTGLVSDTTCTIEGAAPGTGAVVKDVNLGGVSAARLQKPGDRANLTGFTIRIGAPGEGGCTNGRTAMVAFDPTSPAIDVATGRLNIDGYDDPSDTTNAKNVQVEVTNRNGTPINVYTEKSEGVVIADNQAVIPLAAQMYASGVATEGTVKTRVGFMVVYAD